MLPTGWDPNCWDWHGRSDLPCSALSAICGTSAIVNSPLVPGVASPALCFQPCGSVWHQALSQISYLTVSFWAPWLPQVTTVSCSFFSTSQYPAMWLAYCRSSVQAGSGQVMAALLIFCLVKSVPKAILVANMEDSITIMVFVNITVSCIYSVSCVRL